MEIIDITMKRKSLNTDDLVRLYQSGLLYVDIAKKFGVSWMAIRRRILGAGIKSKSYAEVQRIKASRMTPEERSRCAAAAHEAVRSRRHSFKEKCQRAKTREHLGLGISRIEIIVAEKLREKGFGIILQKAIGPYNVDIAITELSIIVEIFGGHWHTASRHADRFKKRFNYLLNQGWLPIIVWISRSYPLEDGAIKYIISFAEKIRRGETMRRQEHMIYGNGEVASLGKRKFNGLPIIMRPNTRDNATGRFNKIAG